MWSRHRKDGDSDLEREVGEGSEPLRKTYHSMIQEDEPVTKRIKIQLKTSS